MSSGPLPPPPPTPSAAGPPRLPRRRKRSDSDEPPDSSSTADQDTGTHKAYRTYNAWTSTDEERLVEALAKKIPYKQIALSLNHSWQGIATRAAQLKKQNKEVAGAMDKSAIANKDSGSEDTPPPPPKRAKVERTWKSWTTADDEKLWALHLQGKKPKDVHDLFDRSSIAVSNRLTGLKKKRQAVPQQPGQPAPVFPSPIPVASASSNSPPIAPPARDSAGAASHSPAGGTPTLDGPAPTCDRRERKHATAEEAGAVTNEESVEEADEFADEEAEGDEPEEVRLDLGAGRIARPAADTFDAEAYRVSLIEDGHVYDWLVENSSTVPPPPTLSFDQAAATHQLDRPFLNPHQINGEWHVSLLPHDEIRAQAPEDPTGGPLCRHLIHDINSFVDRGILDVFTGTPSFWHDLFTSKTLHPRISHPGRSKLHFVIAGNKAQDLVEILIAANDLHHTYNKEISPNRKLPADYDASPFFTFSVLERPARGTNTDHSKLRLFSRIDMQALTEENGSANLSSSGCGAIGLDNANSIGRNISHEVMSVRTSPLGHPIALAAAAVFSRHLVLKRQSGLLRPLDPISWASAPSASEREAAREERRVEAQTDEDLLALTPPPRPHPSAYDLEAIPSAKERQVVRFTSSKTGNFRAEYFPSIPTHIVAICYGCLRHAVILWDPTSGKKNDRAATNGWTHESLFCAPPAGCCVSQSRLLSATFAVKAEQFGPVLTTDRSDRFTFDTTGSQRLRNFIKQVIEPHHHTIRLGKQTHVSWNPLHCWYGTLDHDLARGPTIDSSIRDFALSLQEDHPGRHYLLSKLNYPGLIRQELYGDFGTQISVGTTRTSNAEPLVLAKQSVALARHVLQRAVLTAKDPFDPILDNTLRASITSEPIPATVEERKKRDALLASRDRKSYGGRGIQPAVEETDDEEEADAKIDEEHNGDVEGDDGEAASTPPSAPSARALRRRRGVYRPAAPFLLNPVDPGLLLSPSPHAADSSPTPSSS